MVAAKMEYHLVFELWVTQFVIQEGAIPIQVTKIEGAKV
jgi:hypothetical protein